MSLIHWHPLKELSHLRQQMNSLFEEMTHRHHGLGDRDINRLVDFDLFPDRLGISWKPAIELTETETELILTAELPGIEAKDLDIQVSDNLVSIAGERKREKYHQTKGGFSTELCYGKFERVIPLSIAIDKNKVQANLNNGLLTLSLPKNKSASENAVKVNLIDSKAREAMTQQRQHQEHQQESIHERAVEELTERQDNAKRIQEEAREVMAGQRQQEKHQQETMHARTAAQVSDLDRDR
jgi:HSP20 family protein